MSELHEPVRADGVHLSDLQLDRLLAGELQNQRADIDAHLAVCAVCSARKGELEQSAADFPQQVWIEGDVQKVKKQVRSFWPFPAVAAAAAALLAVLFVPRADAPVDNGGVRFKGGVALSVFSKVGNGERLVPGAQLKAGDAIRFAVTADKPGTAYVLSLDSAGAVTLYAQATVKPGRDVLLDGATELDDALGDETLILAHCEGAVSAADVTAAGKRALASAGSPRKVETLGLDCRESVFRFVKVGR